MSSGARLGWRKRRFLRVSNLKTKAVTTSFKDYNLV
jgi:hypothetical protein